MFNRSKRVTKIARPVPVNPITNRPYGQTAPQRDEQAEAEIAAGQLALATATPPRFTARVGVGFDPHRSAWRGTRP